jgi:hypothetical protein
MAQTSVIRKKQEQAQQSFEKLVNQQGLRDMKVAHYESELGSLRLGIGLNADGVVAGITKWYYPELDQEGKSYHYSWTYQGDVGDTVEQAHREMLEYGENFAQEMLSGRVTK